MFHAVTFEQGIFMEIALLISIPMYIALRQLVSLFGRLVAWGGKIAVTDRQTDTHTHRHTYQVR